MDNYHHLTRLSLAGSGGKAEKILSCSKYEMDDPDQEYVQTDH